MWKKEKKTTLISMVSNIDIVGKSISDNLGKAENSPQKFCCPFSSLKHS
jgi:hypothetical protein